MASIQDLIAGKQYAKALLRLQAELRQKPKDPRLRLRYADVLILDGKEREAVKALLELADDHAAEGFTAKAIAVLKRVEKLEPRRPDLKSRLAKLVHEKVSQAPSAPSGGGGFEFGMEEFDPSQEIAIGGAPVSVDVPASPAPEPEPPAPEFSPAAVTPEPEPFGGAPEPLEITPDPVEVTPDPAPLEFDDTGDLEGLDEITLDPEPEPRGETSFLSSPIFEGLSEEELMAFIAGLNFDSYAAGDILVAEGAPGESLFILTEGRVKAFVKEPKGHYKLVKELGEGDFFGEVSVLTGKPRTATITAAADCEVLELDRPTLDAITRKYPRVRQVLKKFHEKRAQATVEALLRKQ